MNHIIKIGYETFQDFNERVFVEADGFELCEDWEVFVHESDIPDELGRYLERRGRQVIILHKYLSVDYRDWVFFHEISHVRIHSTLACNFTVDMRRKIETEANILAAMLLIPRNVLLKYTPGELQSEFNYPKKLIEIRIWIFKQTGQ